VIQKSPSAAYDPREVEARWAAHWEKAGLFKPAERGGDPFTIVIPPPNVTGILHMGHALNNTLQDVLVRFERMRGRPVLWVPGTDHAGIATQNVVERKLAGEKRDRHQLGRERFIEQVWAWKQAHGSTIVKQLKRLGASCDWSRQRFTMDEGLSRAVQTAFLTLHENGLIYRGYYLVNWCPRCRTALSDEEVQHEPLKGKLWQIRYPDAAGGEGVVVATTRPETLLGDVAVAVHPEDPRYKKLHAQKLRLPILDRLVPVITDPGVDRAFGTGAVKITPAHDPTDFALGQKHGLAAIRVMNAEGRMNEAAGPYRGQDRFDCRENILADLEAAGLLVKTEDYDTSVGHCYRCRTVVEPMLSPQWFVEMKPLAKLGIEAVQKDGMTFSPERWTKVYLDWLANIRDWCISRQIWWGHRIPAWSCRRCTPAYVEKQAIRALSGNQRMDEQAAGIHVGPEAPEKCRSCGGTDLEQDPDVLDTWFSSWLWPFSVFGWPGQTADLKRFYPTSTLVTAPDIIFFWVARMVMAGKYFMKRLPFKQVVIHGVIRVEGGKKMSKSAGNSIDPLQIIDRMGADTLRFSIAQMASEGQDLYLSEGRFLLGRNFCNKLWNAARLVLGAESFGKIAPAALAKVRLTLADKWILSRFEATRAGVTEALDQFRFSEAARQLYAFVWNEFCDWYLEIAKLQRQSDDPGIAAGTEIVLGLLLEKTLRLLHPIIPFITEELWQQLPESLRASSAENAIMTAPWPAPETPLTDGEAEQSFSRLQELITQVRNIRAGFRVPAGRKVPLTIAAPNGADLLRSHLAVIERLAGVHPVEIGGKAQRPAGSVAAPVGDWTVIVQLAGLVDLAVERKRIEKELQNLTGRMKSKQGRLKNDAFRSKAPAEVIEQEEASLKELEQEMARWNESLRQIR